MKKRDTQKRCLKRKREKSFKNAKNKNENIFSKREKTFVQKKKKRLIKRTLFFYKKGNVYQKNTIFSVFCVFFFSKN